MTALLKLCGRTLGWHWLPTLTATVLCVALAGCTRNNNLNVRGDGFEDNSMGETVRQARPQDKNMEVWSFSNKAQQIERDFGVQ